MTETHWPPRYAADYVPPSTQEHWLPGIETMHPQERDVLILAKLREQVRYAYRNSGFYREFYDDAPVDPDYLGSLEEFSKLPILSKEDIRREQEEHPPYGRFLCVPSTDVFRVHGTSGTTGRPTVFGISRDDWDRIAEAHARILWGAGLRPDDLVMVAAVFSLYVGSWGALVGAERLGATCFPFGGGAPGQTERAAEWAAMVKPTALYGTPSYALYLAETARQMGLDPLNDFAFRFMFFSGEPGASVPATRKLIEDTYGCYVVDQGSMAEMTPWMSNSGCRHLPQGMHLWQDIVYTELVDPEANRNLPMGAEGVPVYSHTERTSQPMIRYWSGDIAQWEMIDCPLWSHLPDPHPRHLRAGRRHDYRTWAETSSLPESKTSCETWTYSAASSACCSNGTVENSTASPFRPRFSPKPLPFVKRTKQPSNRCERKYRTPFAVPSVSAWRSN